MLQASDLGFCVREGLINFVGSFSPGQWIARRKGDEKGTDLFLRGKREVVK